MCGIIGYTGSTPALPILLEGLSALEYRGYDSAGVALSEGSLEIVKAKGRLAALKERLEGQAVGANATCGIGHTRWATHGAPNDRNAHPHATKRLALVHNGIIENYAELGRDLEKRGYRFVSETDTEVAACLLDRLYGESADPIRAIFETVSLLRGSFALGVIFADRPQCIYAVRRDSPLIVAETPTGGLIASDVPAVLAHSKSYYRLQEDIVAVLEPDGLRFIGRDGREVTKQSECPDWSVEQAQKGGWPHFMLKEIHEEPEALRKTVSHYLRHGLPAFGLGDMEERLARFERIHLVACGTAMHAGLIGRHVIERLARTPALVEMASEFRYRSPILTTKDLVILLSQSGETADTLAALRLAKSRGVTTLAIVNVVGSSVAREADFVLYTPAGPEIAVASTKAYSVQCALLYLLALYLALQKGTLDEAEVRAMCEALLVDMPQAVEAMLRQSDAVREQAEALMGAEHLFYIGRDVDRELCTEGSLKLKEISYIHSEAYAAGELKHGTISLIEEGTPVVALLTVSALAEKMISGIREVRSRGARVMAVMTREIAERFDVPCDSRIVLPHVDEGLAPFPAACALQLLAYHVAALKGVDVDKPRNLAKSVTVE